LSIIYSVNAFVKGLMKKRTKLSTDCKSDVVKDRIKVLVNICF